jgi:DNA invertase Pin-like site-specific DNA recombinase
MNRATEETRRKVIGYIRVSTQAQGETDMAEVGARCARNILCDKRFMTAGRDP